MSTRNDHAAVSELLGAYALDAVDPDEAVAIEDHLRECPRCRDEVNQHREVAAQLAFVGETAPEGIWEQIAANLAPAQPEPDLARLYPLSTARPVNRWVARVLLPVAAALLVLVGALGWEVHSQADRVGRINTAFQKTTTMEQAVQAALVDPRSSKFALTSADGQIHVDAVLEPDGVGYLLPPAGAALPRLPASETYELWGVADGQAVSLGLLGSHPTVEAFKADSSRLYELAITAEKAGGVVRSTHAPVVAGQVPATPPV
jgi:predicted anti-sigma-YlaC factor YlaD